MRSLILLLSILSLPAHAGSDLDLFERDGTPIAVRPADGQLLLLHFWATWCPTCADDLAHLEAAAASCAAGRVQVYAVNVGEDESIVAEWMRQHSLNLPVLLDPKGRAWRELDGRGVPLNVYWSVDRRETDVGPKSTEDWLKRFEELGCGT
jgi:thiol-disulfide isomerase/thioredoxin